MAMVMDDAATGLTSNSEGEVVAILVARRQDAAMSRIRPDPAPRM